MSGLGAPAAYFAAAVTETAAHPPAKALVAHICYSGPMTKEVRLRQAGGSVSATLPKHMADRLRLEAGDRVLAVETDGGILLTPYDPEVERALEVAAQAARKYRNVLRALAK
jgi:putative addiction module antidote